jgi:hypothetical protein
MKAQEHDSSFRLAPSTLRHYRAICHSWPRLHKDHLELKLGKL